MEMKCAEILSIYRNIRLTDILMNIVSMKNNITYASNLMNLPKYFKFNYNWTVFYLSTR